MLLLDPTEMFSKTEETHTGKFAIESDFESVGRIKGLGVVSTRSERLKMFFKVSNTKLN